jgi:Domain of unknown function (DUF5916)/Carbohydrate family 9 binding domain-like
MLARRLILVIPVLSLLFELRALAQSAEPAPADAAVARQERVRLLRNETWEVTATRADAPIVVDGRVDEPVWDRAVPVSNFYQRERNEGLPASERTEVRVVYDDERLYVGFRCFDRSPELVKARAIFRDEQGSADDLVSVMIDSYNGDRSAIQFVSNANGLLEDLLQTGETQETRNPDFDIVWRAEGRFTETGYEVEMAIPFKSLRFAPPAPDQEVVFGIGFKRNIPRKNEEMYWPFVPNDSSWYRPAELGQLKALRDIEPGRNLQVRPYVLGGGSRDFVADQTDPRREVGIDAKWGMTTGLTADFTVNTDFAQEEADVQQINFTRFNLFFPEKRQFFLEGQQAFQFGLPEVAELVFTRRIGLSPEGEIVPIIAGARLSGRQGRTTVGAMNIQADDFDVLASQNFTVVRVKQDVLNRSSVGALFTNVQGGGEFNRVAGADVSLFFKRVWFIEGWASLMDDTGHQPGRHAGYGRLAYDADRFGVEYQYLDIGENFRPGIGFIERPDSRSNELQGRWSPRPPSRRIRRFNLEGTLGYITDQQNTLETRERSAEFGIELESGDVVSVEYTNGLESIDEPFTIQGRPIPPGTYRSNTIELRLETFRRRHTTLNVDYETGGFWSGHRDTLSVDAAWRLSTKLGLSGSYDFNRIELAGDRFNTHLVSSRIQFAFNNEMALLGLLQYNHAARIFSTNIRYQWIVRPGSEFFIVYNELDDVLQGNSRFPNVVRRSGVRNRSLVVKLNYLFNL